jgi:hypothetical protein
MTKSHGSCLSENSLGSFISNALVREWPDAVSSIEEMAAAKKAKKQAKKTARDSARGMCDQRDDSTL